MKFTPLAKNIYTAGGSGGSDSSDKSHLWPLRDLTQWTTQLPKRVKNEKKITGSKIGAIFCKIASRITTQNLKIGPQALFEKFAFLFFPKIPLNLTSEGQKYPQRYEFNMKHVLLYVGHFYKPFWTKKI